MLALQVNARFHWTALVQFVSKRYASPTQPPSPGHWHPGDFRPRILGASLSLTLDRL
jgi:hypothetical protein